MENCGGGLEGILEVIFASGIKLLKEGNRQEMIDSQRQDNMVNATMLIGNKEVKGTYTGNKITKLLRNNFWCCCPVYHLIASGEGEFDAGEITYKGRFFNNLFHDNTGKAEYFIGSKTKYIGCFKKGKREGPGKLEKYMEDEKTFKTTFNGIWKKDKPFKGSLFIQDGTELRVVNGEIQGVNNGNLPKSRFTGGSIKIFPTTFRPKPLIQEKEIEIEIRYNNPSTKFRRQSTIDYSHLIQEKLKNPHKELSLEDSIGLLVQCIKQGLIEAEKAKGKEIVIFIGNTGAGKSTAVNYLYGCEMELKKPKDLGIKGFEKVVVVKSKASGGRLDELMPIGHTKKSQTFMPQIETDKTNVMTYVDCPGFLDNRGPEINIANAVNIKNSIKNAKSVKVIMLINYHSLKADRGRGLLDMLKISSDLFGNTKNLLKHKESVLIGVTQAPLDMDLEALKEWVVEDNLEAIQPLSQRIFTFDPLDRKTEGGWTRQEIRKNVNTLMPITNHSKIFSTVLTDKDENKLVKISEEIGARIESRFKKPIVETEDFQYAAKQFYYLKDLSIVEHVTVERLLARNQSRIERGFQDIINDFNTKCSLENFKEAKELLKTLNESMHYFDESLKGHLHINKLEKHYNACKEKQARIEAKEEEYRKQLKSANRRIEDMIKLLDEQKKSTEQQLQEQKAVFKEMLNEQAQKLDQELQKYDKERNALQIELVKRLQKKEEELGRTRGLNNQEIKSKIKEEREKLKHDYDKQVKALEKEKNQFKEKEEARLKQREQQQLKEQQKLQEKIRNLELQKTEQSQQKQAM